MESKSTQPVQRPTLWGAEARSNAKATPSDPLAFFDMIMATARQMSLQAGAAPGALQGHAAPAADWGPSLATDDNPQWHDDSHRPGRAIYEPTPVTSATIPAEAEPAADEHQPPQDEQSPEADAAALATGAALVAESQPQARQPDTSPAAEDESEPTSTAPPNSTPIKVAGEADQPLSSGQARTDQPLDTSVQSTEALNQAGAEQELSEAAAATRREADQQQSDPRQAAAEIATDEAESIRQKDDASHPHRSEEAVGRQQHQVETQGREGEVLEGDVGDNSQEPPQRDPRQQERSQRNDPRSPAGESALAKPAPAAPAASATSATATAAVAEPPSQVTVPTGNSSTVATATGSANGTHGMGITSLLQRGLQGGTLQKPTQSPEARQLDPKQQIRLINRVARAVESTPPGQAIRIRLNPAELGALKVEIKLEGTNMIARIEAENPATRQVLLENLPQLRERLSESNINVQQFEVDLMGQESATDRGTSQLADQREQRRESASTRHTSDGESSDDQTDADVATPHRTNKEAERDSRNLNITI